MRCHGWLTCLLLFAALPAAAQLSPDQKSADFQELAALFAKRYAFIEWKNDTIHFDGLNLRPWLDRIKNSRDDLDFFEICAEYVAQYQDGHTHFELQSDFNATLGLTADIYDGKILIDSIDRTRLPADAFPMTVGDELIALDGKNLAVWISDITRLFGDGNPRTANRQAVALALSRLQYLIPRAHEIQDNAIVMVRRKATGATESYTVPWKKSGTPYVMAGPVPTPRSNTLTGKHGAPSRGGDAPGPWPSYMARTRSFQVMRKPDTFVRGVGAIKPVFNLPDSFVQRLGSRRYDSIFTGVLDYQELKIGFLRVPRFGFISDSDLQTEIAYLQSNTDGLVLDITRNPGGYGCTAEQLMGYLTADSMHSAGNQIRVTWDLLSGLQDDLDYAHSYGTADDVAEVERLLADARKAYAQSRGFTPPEPICGNSFDISPAKGKLGNIVAYTKPVLLLIDEFSASAADLFASVLQDNKRALLYGMRTDGAGASVNGADAGVYSETGLAYAQSILVRRSVVNVPPYGDTNLIENVGVRPDKVDDYMTEDNLLNDGKTFVANFLAAMADQIKAAKAK